MAHYDLIIKGGTVATAADTFNADIGIRDGRIAALADALDGASEVIDARGKLVLPGGVDSHCHIAQISSGGLETADDFESGTRSALCGGTTTIIPFADQHRGQSLRQRPTSTTPSISSSRTPRSRCWARSCRRSSRTATPPSRSISLTNP
jgi:dihydropyrimidinase